MTGRLHGKWIVMACMLLGSLTFESARSQSTHIIYPREYSTALPSVYPSGIYIMDSENDAPYSWGHDASMILGLKRSQTNFRHVQMLIWRDGSQIKIRGKDGQNDSWLSWRRIRDEKWIKDNFLKKDEEGNVGIGVTNPSSKLEVNGDIRAKEVIVEATGWPDYVFKPAYPLPSLSELEIYIKEHGHLPGIPAKEQVEAEGQNLGEVQKKLLKKIEELTLYLIEQQKTIDQGRETEVLLTKRLDSQQEVIDALIKRIEQLESEKEAP